MPVEWRPVLGFEKYQISDTGVVIRLVKIKAFPAGSVVQQFTNKDGYRYVYLRNNRSRVMRAVHLLVIESFVGKRKPGWVTHHKDLEKTNNHLSNLKYLPREEHNRLHGLLQFTPPELKKPPKPLVKHLDLYGKPMCTPNTKRDDLPLVSDEEEITCVRCLFRLGKPPVGTYGF